MLAVWLYGSGITDTFLRCVDPSMCTFCFKKWEWSGYACFFCVSISLTLQFLVLPLHPLQQDLLQDSLPPELPQLLFSLFGSLLRHNPNGRVPTSSDSYLAHTRSTHFERRIPPLWKTQIRAHLHITHLHWPFQGSMVTYGVISMWVKQENLNKKSLNMKCKNYCSFLK